MSGADRATGPAVRTLPGKPLPLGPVLAPAGTQFALFSRHATQVSLVLFDGERDTTPRVEIPLDPARNRTGDVWHVFVEGIGAGQLYLYRVDGPWDPERGHRFNANILLLDPYAKATAGEFPNPKGVVVDDDFDWEGDRPLNYPLRFSVIYETHVRGLTIDPSAKVRHPGTYRGVIEKIPYLKSLGITALELLPVQEFDERELKTVNPLSGERLTNYWGYSTVSFFAPKRSYASSEERGGQIREFKEMVRSLHREGIEVILDIVFNHTAEGGERGPTYCFRGLDNRIYYILGDDKRTYRNYSGVGNTLNCNNPIVRGLIVDCLHYWVVEMHVDGFRFDLGSILGRDQKGRLMENPPVLERIAEDPILRNTKIIAEAWDAAGAYQVGWFPGGRWAEWNDRFRDDVRRFWLTAERVTANFATRLTGSSDLYLRDGRKPFHSVNFVTSHDGFTLSDLVSYGRKHNEANGEGGRDGLDQNFSNNYGEEGETDDLEIRAARARQIKNLIATLLLSLGTPMFLGGDEFGRTQAGNNNAYCHDGPLSWYDWSLADRNRDLVRFFSALVAFRRRHPAFLRPEFYTGKESKYNAIPDVTWYDEEGSAPDWNAMDKLLALRIDGSRAEVYADRDDNDFFMMFNATARDVDFTVCPAPDGKLWFRVLDTAAAPPGELLDLGDEELLADQRAYPVKARSTVLLLTKAFGERTTDPRPKGA